MQQNMHNWYIFYALLSRDVKILAKTLISRFIDGTFLLCTQVLGFGYLLPLAGMPAALIAPVFLGTMTRIFLFLGYGFALRRVLDIKDHHIIDYHLTLPLSKTWLIGQYIVSFMIEALLVSFPLLMLGMILLQPSFPFAQINWIAFALIYPLIILFYAILFAYLGFSSQYEWFMDNIWARRLTPLAFLGCSLVSWKATYAFSPFFAVLFLFNPLTYVNEGLRASLLGTHEYLPLWICISVISASCLFLLWLLAHAVNKRLDPV